MDVGRLVAGQPDRRARIADIPGFKRPASLDDQNVAALDVDVLRVVGGERWHQRRLWCRQVWLPPDHAHPPRISDIDDGPPHCAVAAVGKPASALIDNSELIGLIPAFGPGLTGKPHIVETKDFETRYVPIARLHQWQAVVVESPTGAGYTQTGAGASRLQKSPSIHSHDFLLVIVAPGAMASAPFIGP